MFDKFYTLQEIIIDAYEFNAPIEIEKGFLLLDKTSRDILLKLKLNILGIEVSQVSSVSLNINCMNDAEEILTDISPYIYTYRDVFLNQSETFGEDFFIPLDQRVRRVIVGIQRVVFTDSTTWIPSNNQFTPPKQELITSLQPELLEQFQRDNRSLTYAVKKHYKFIPEQLDNYWLCTCGRPNNNDAVSCSRCSTLKNTVFQISENVLEENLDKYKEQIRQEQEKARIAKEQARLQARAKAQKRAELNARLQEEANNRLKRKRTLLVITTLVGLLIALFLFIVLPAIKYSQASNFLENKNYNYAIYIFDSLGDFKNSEEMVAEANYQKAIDFFDNKNFDDAIKTFSYIETYRDSSTKIKEAIYQIAEIYLHENNYLEAIELFSQLEDFSDSNERLLHTRWLLANQYLKDENLAKAIEILETLGDYEDSTILIQETKYSLAYKYYILGDFASAQAFFQDISGYKNSSMYIKRLDILNGIQGNWYHNHPSLGWKIVRFVGWKIKGSRVDGRGWEEHGFSDNSFTPNGLLIEETVFPFEYNHIEQTLVMHGFNGKFIEYKRTKSK